MLIINDPSTYPINWPNLAVFGCINSPTILCAKEISSGAICAGDSGSAVVADRDGDGVWVQYGIVSFGTNANGGAGCGDATHEGYTDVSLWTDRLISIIANDLGESV